MVLISGERENTLLISYGSIVQNCLAVQKENPLVSVLAFNCLRPIDEKTVGEIISGYEKVFVVEQNRDASFNSKLSAINDAMNLVTNLTITQYSLTNFN